MLPESLQYVHCPPWDAPREMLQRGMHPTQQRLAFEKLLAHQLSLQKWRHHIREENAPSFKRVSDYQKKLLDSLPFQLTNAQERVIQEILADCEQAKPMLRLVQGDVGSGKTIVAALAILQAVEGGYQAALMAPTELLGEQHLKNFKRWFSEFDISVGWLSGNQTNREREKILTRIKEGKDQVVIGTHALFQPDVEFHQLALLVIDEQHRFGVHQRLALKEKAKKNGWHPHQLVMTATPIPRTLAMTIYSDLDCSIIDEIPPGRKPITTVLIPNTRRKEILERVRENCRHKKQAYWICTLIEESEALQSKQQKQP